MIFFQTWHCFLCDFPRPAHVCRQVRSRRNFRLKLVEEQNSHYSPPPRLLHAIHHHSTQIADILTLVASSVSDDATARFGQVSVKLFRHLEAVIGQIASDYSVREIFGQVTVGQGRCGRREPLPLGMHGTRCGRPRARHLVLGKLYPRLPPQAARFRDNLRRCLIRANRSACPETFRRNIPLRLAC
jgi:hypothetical protein